MQERTLKEVAQAGLVLGFEWISSDPHGVWMYEHKPYQSAYDNFWYNGSAGNCMPIMVTDLPPEKSLLKLSDIVEGKIC